MVKEKQDGSQAETEEVITFITGKPSSIFQMVIVVSLRHKQLNNGANPRVIVSSLKKKNRIAIDEVNQGVITFYTKK
ncbi:MAG: DNA-directed RNA polymerase subunit omega [Pyrinomonadaceae bacterium]|nr:DNA-directed RNA polymerase subunit omega [Pyrinomonadaceae bacterium]